MEGNYTVIYTEDEVQSTRSSMPPVDSMDVVLAATKAAGQSPLLLK